MQSTETHVLTPSAPNENRSTRGFWALIATQFQGAFSDNVLRNLLLSMFAGMALAQGQRETFISLITFLFSLPFVLFSMAGGWLADRYSKRKVTIWTKVMEIASMAVAAFGLYIHSHAITFVALTLVALQAALFGPSKYGAIPELVPARRLSWANGVIELGTFLAIIFGTVTGAFMAESFAGREVLAGYALIAFAFVGLATSFGIDHVPAAAPNKPFRVNFLGDLFHQISLMRRDTPLFLAVVGNTYFWFLGSLLFSTVVVYGREVLHVGATRTGYLNAALAIGIGVGSMIAGVLSGNKIEYGLIPLGALGMTFTGLAIGLSQQGLVGSAALLAVLGLWAGFFAVPVNAMIQHRPDESNKGGIIAAANLLSFVGVALSSAAYFIFTNYIHLDPRGVMVAGSIITGVGTIYVLWLLPEWFLRFLLWIATHTIYRIKVIGRERVPQREGALLVVNHMSFVDALLLIASIDRPIRFLVYKGIYDMPIVKPFAKMMKAIPISSEQRPREMVRSLRDASDAIRAGELVCIFAEGQITRTGQLLPFRRGFERIMKGLEAPIIPVNLDGVWGSIFSFERGRFLWKMPRKVPYPVTVSFGERMPATSTATEVRASVQGLQAEAFAARKRFMRTLDESFVRNAHLHPFRFLMADGRTPKVRFGSALVKSIFVAERLRKHIGEAEMVGLLLPPSVGGAVSNFALSLLGRVPVNLNYTASGEVIGSCAQQCEIEVVITSKAFVERFPNLAIPGRTLLLEDIAENAGVFAKLKAIVIAALPYKLIKRAIGGRRQKLDDLATVIFSSGSTGDPKGVMLTHYNIASNVAQVSQVFMLDGRDKVLGILPFFHSFGFTATLWLPVSLGLGVVYHPSPLDARAISALVGRYNVTFVIATPTFLQAYIRRCSPEHFGSVQYVLTGAEKLSDRVALAFEDTFGIRPLEGYGCTECSPVVTVNGRDFRAPGFRQVGARRGRIGHPLPGMSVRVLDLETMEPVAPGKSGMLVVKGPNVMKGYLGRPAKTEEVLKDGWYTTGDVAVLEEDGFLTITDRLTRFSKIGGEMVPHIKIEDKLHEIAEVTEQTFAVTSIPDEKKGERIVVLHTLTPERLAPILEKLATAGLPPLWKPRNDQFFHIAALPMLGTGKIDLRSVKQQAMELSSTQSASI